MNDTCSYRLAFPHYGERRRYRTECGRMVYESLVNDWRFCPYCGSEVHRSTPKEHNGLGGRL